MTAVIVLIILFVFMAMFVAVWLWYLKSEANVAQRFYNIGLKAFEKNDYNKAIKLLLRALDLKGDYKEARFSLALSYVGNNDYEKAKESFESALSIDSNDFDTLYNYASMLQSQNKNEEAKTFYTKALAVNNNSVECNLNLGLLTLKENDFQKALEYFQKALELSPDSSEAAFFIVKCKDEQCSYATEDEGQLIIEEYLKIVNKENLPPSYDASLAKAYAKLGQAEKAMTSCKKALALNDKDIESYKLLALIQMVQKDFLAAKTTLSTAVNLDKNDAEVHELLSYVLCQHDDRNVVKKCRLKYQETIKKVLKK